MNFMAKLINKIQFKTYHFCSSLHSLAYKSLRFPIDKLKFLRFPRVVPSQKCQNRRRHRFEIPFP